MMVSQDEAVRRRRGTQPPLEYHHPWSSYSSEADLIGAAQDGDASALTELFRRHDDALRGFVFGLLYDKSALDDVLQDAYMKACVSLRAFRGESGFKTWLHRIAFTVAIDSTRKKRGIPSDEAIFIDIEDAVSQPGDQVGAHIDVRNALNDLSERQRAAVLLVDGYGFENTEEAAVLDIAPGTVGVHLSRGREAMRIALGINQKEGRND